MGVMEKTVLIIEDENSLLSALKAKLTTAGFATLEARDGESGLDLALEKHPDLILLDIMMPHTDGIAMLDELRKDEWGKGAKVVVLTNLDSMRSVQEVMEKGVFEHFVKSDVQLEEIVERIGGMLE